MIPPRSLLLLAILSTACDEPGSAPPRVEKQVAAETPARPGPAAPPKKKAAEKPAKADAPVEPSPPEEPTPPDVPPQQEPPEPNGGLPLSLPDWKASGPFATVKWSKGPLAVDPVAAGDGELPHSPTSKIDPEQGTPMDHVERFGWSRDGETFAYCLRGGAECPTCSYVSAADGTIEQQDVCDAAGRARWKKGGYTPGPTTWRYGDLTVAWRVVPEKEGQALQLGLRRGEVAAVDPMTIVLDVAPPGDVFPEVLALSPDGSRLAVLAHGWEGEGTDVLVPRLVPTGWLAAPAYDAAGAALLSAGDPRGAVEQFLRATVADPQSADAPYHAAQAYAKLGDQRVKAALLEAIRRGGAPVEARARRDPKLAPTRAEPWFGELVGG